MHTPGLGPTVPELGLSEFPDIKPIEKTQFSMMTAEVTKLMQERGLDSVVLCGIEAHVCVQNTALALLERGFNVHVAADACSSRTMVDRWVHACAEKVVCRFLWLLDFSPKESEE
ncbi:hypothetical protein HPB48_025352 [Haemaphysalis longicornis]|uniref:Isochorismatase-like domain-containing protein n=1 Tax=Haemaphysalis longicornis TaxID=44386 RepID=A0A9J6GYY3_HAELO|nr:hypothetical protein HPB48_025352 [Haemaphysalis longicornis]